MHILSIYSLSTGFEKRRNDFTFTAEVHCRNDSCSGNGICTDIVIPGTACSSTFVCLCADGFGGQTCEGEFHICPTHINIHKHNIRV